MKNDGLYKHVRELNALSTAVTALAEEAPDRMTLSQGLVFLMAAASDINGAPTTFTEIKEAVGDQIGRSLHSTYRILLRPARTHPKGLGWLDRFEDPYDNRRKYLKLTPKGRKKIKKVLAARAREPA